MPNLKINNKTYSGVNEVHIPLASGSGNEDFAYITSETKSITENGTHDVKHYGTVNVNVPTEGEGIIPSGTKTITENGTYDVTEYASAKVEVPSEEPNIQSLNVTANGTYTAPSGIDGYSPITVNVPTESDIELQRKTVTPSETAQTITPDSGYDGLASVSVGAISANYVGSGVTRKSAQTYTPGTSDQTIPSGRYLTGVQTLKGDANFLEENIRAGVVMWGKTGSYQGTGGIDTSDATATAADMAEGVTAYVNGQKVTGNIPIGAFEYENAFLVFSNSMLNLYAYSLERQILEYGDKISLFCNASVLGDATAADVAKGKTFTSSSGLNVTGTHECSSGGSGGGLPSGISKLATGSFTPASDQTTGQIAYHELGVVPDIVACWADTGDADVPSGYSGYFLYSINFASNYTKSGSTNNGINSCIYAYGSNLTTSIGSAQMRSDYFVAYPSRCSFKAGVTHHWVAVKFE